MVEEIFHCKNSAFQKVLIHKPSMLISGLQPTAQIGPFTSFLPKERIQHGQSHPSNSLPFIAKVETIFSVFTIFFKAPALLSKPMKSLWKHPHRNYYLLFLNGISLNITIIFSAFRFMKYTHVSMHIDTEGLYSTGILHFTCIYVLIKAF